MTSSRLHHAIENKRGKLLKAYSEHNFTPRALILYCVDHSTFRAFRYSKTTTKTDYLTYKPSSIFRTWAFRFLSSQHDLLNTATFIVLHTAAVKSLRDFWIEKDGAKPDLYKFRKLVDLMFKMLPRLESLSPTRSQYLYENGYAPIDKYSLACYRNYAPVNTLKVRSNSAMSFVKDSDYEKIQKAFRELSGHPSILFDLFAWDEARNKNREENESPFELIEHEKLQ